MSPQLKHCSTLFITTLVLGQLPAIATASDCKNGIAIAISVQGTIEEKRENLWTPVKRNDTFCAGDIVRVRKNSRAIVRLIKEQTNITLAQHTTISFSEQKEKKSTWLELLKGAANFISRVPQALKIKTPYVNAAVEGTEFLITTEEGQSQISVFEGHVALSNEKGTLDLKSGDTGIAKAGQAPAQSLKVDQVDAVQWTMYYPPIISKPTVSKQKKAPDGDFPPTLDNVDDPKLLTYYASQFLAVGSIDQAEQNIEKALSIDRGDSNALALKSIVAVVKNDKESALKLAKQAVKNNQSAAAHIALSYAHQAHFDLTHALNAAKDAAQAEPNNGIAWARIAELQLSQGNLDKALSAAEKAIKLNPNFAHTQTILGFSYLTKIKTRKAKNIFEKAISLDQSAPLPHLGLGLAMIREGYLEQGRIEIEAATSLDPRNSLIRSYVGKAYYEEKRNDLAAKQFSIAKQLDPKDPTPWFYDAILKQIENDPAGALSNLEKSKELNNNRSVYRSQLLLDQDKASKNINSARIYQDLGFDQVAINEAINALSGDPRNHAAHQFLAGAYANLPRHEIARVSEVLQAQLLQPLNARPVHPIQTESNVDAIESSNLFRVSLNEYSPLFIRNQFMLSGGGLIGGNNTGSEHLIASGLFRNISYSVGQSVYKTDGFRENNDQFKRLQTGFAMAQLTNNTSLQFEARKSFLSSGDKTTRYNPSIDFFSLTRRSKQESTTYRLGLHHSINLTSDILVSVISNNNTGNTTDLSGFGNFDLLNKGTGIQAETQYLHHTISYNNISGLSASDTTIKRTDDVFGFITKSKNDSKFQNLYTYSEINLSNNLQLTLGLSAESFRDEIFDENQINPKLGITWQNTGTTYKAAGFRTLKRPLINNQTIEPTNVAGINQFYDDFEGSDAKNYAFGITHKISDSSFMGLDVLNRDIDARLPLSNPSSPNTSVTFNSKEKTSRLYYYWSPYSWLTNNIEYQYNKFDRELPEDLSIRDFASTLQTQQLPLTIKLIHPTGVKAFLKATFFKQKGYYPVNTFDTNFNPIRVVEEQRDKFWLVDIGIDFQTPDRTATFSFEMKNATDETVIYQEFDAAKPTIYPERILLLNFTFLMQ